MHITDFIFSLMRKGADMGSEIDKIKQLNTKSLTKTVDDSTFIFSILATDQCPIDRATTIVRNMEKVYASIVQQFFSQNQMIDITVDRSPVRYMKRFHQNYHPESVIDFDALDAPEKEKQQYLSFMESTFPDLEVPNYLFEPVMEEAYEGEYRVFLNPTGTYGVAFKEDVCTSDLFLEYKELIREHLSDFDLHPLTASPVVFEAPGDDELRSAVTASYINGLAQRGSNQTLDLDIKRYKEMKAPQLLDREVKKANDMQPYAIQVRLMAVNDKQEFVQYLDFIVGVKAYLHPIKSKELVTNICYILQNKNFTFNMIRWVTGEISLFKNIILNIDEIKFDVTNQASGMSSWIPTLKRLRNKRIATDLFSVHKLVPNNTIILTSYEVDEIKSMTGQDLRDAFVAKKLIEKLFTIALIIVDDGTETIDILYDSRSDYQTYSLETLEREVSMNSNRLGKEIGRMISR